MEDSTTSSKHTQASVEIKQSGTAESAVVKEHDQDAQKDLMPILTVEETHHMLDLGLGRGINATDPNFWNNKSPWQVRLIKADLSNVIGTDEGGSKQKYEKTVSSLRTQRSKIAVSVREPTSHVKIGLDAHYSQSSNSTVHIKGTKVKTRTISFRSDFDDIPTDVLKESGSQNIFEENMSQWVLQMLKAYGHPIDLPSHGESSTAILNKFAQSIPSIESKPAKDIASIIHQFFVEFGITHYVSSIELGALEFSKERSRTNKSSGGVGANIEAASFAKAGASTSLSTEFSSRTKETQTIGHFNSKGGVDRNSSGEAVISFQIQPITKLITISNIRLATVGALETFLQAKTDHTCKFCNQNTCKFPNRNTC